MPEKLLNQRSRPTADDSLVALVTEGKFLAKIFKKKSFVFGTGGSPGELIFGKGVGRCGARWRPAEAATLLPSC